MTAPRPSLVSVVDQLARMLAGTPRAKLKPVDALGKAQEPGKVEAQR